MSDIQNSNNDEWESLVDRHLFGELSESEQERLAELLDSDTSLRRDFVERTSWETELAELLRSGKGHSGRSDESFLSLPDAAPTGLPGTGKIELHQSRSIRDLRRWLAIAGVAILMLSALLLTSRRRSEIAKPNRPDELPGNAIAQITGLSGSLIWMGDRGQIIREITLGTDLAGGTIEGLSPDSWFELEFNDGSQVTISGASMLTFSDNGQKRLRLREGRMSADVAQQPKGKPMVIQTRTATLTVLGTSFDVEAGLPATAVSVREGTVRVTRTSDGKEVDVPANHRVVAGADQEFERRQIATVVRHWKSHIHQGFDEAYGSWIAATETEPALLRAVAFVPKENQNVVLYLLGLGVLSDEGAPIQVDADSRFEIQGKIDVETEIYFGVQVTYSNGDYAGKFRAKCAVQRDAAGNFFAIANLADFGLDPSVAAYKDKLPPSPEGLFVNGVWSFTHSGTPSGLRISQVELINKDLTSGQ
ncbi:MAG: FecR family protein [Planctomycetota bacterium]|nr:FecR family protein [Planctomycetota bacterium]